MYVCTLQVEDFWRNREGLLFSCLARTAAVESAWTEGQATKPIAGLDEVIHQSDRKFRELPRLGDS